jgi:hypothetical protein
MAQKTKKVEVEPQVETTEEVVTEFFEETVVAEPKKKTVAETPKPKKDTWEIKDRVYFLKSNKKPISKLLKGSGIHWFDENAGYERELKYTSNQRTCFVDEMTGDQRLEHIIFRNGNLAVPKKQNGITKNAIFIPPDERYSICRAQASSSSG